MIAATMAGTRALLATLLCCLSVVFATPLDDYVNKYDPTYEYRDLGNPFKGIGYTTYFLNMTSQTWLSSSEVSQSIWWHYLVINIPDKVEYTDTAFLYITGGSNTDGLPEIDSSDCLIASTMAFTTGTVTAALFQVPNQPIVFSEDPLKKRRTEDAIIAFTWYYFFNHINEPEYLLRLPMTKAAVRAMDTMASFSSTKNQIMNLKKFVVAGASKRGWTTWTTGAVDKRVIGIIPIVMDELNISTNLHHQYRAYGGWTFAFKDYTDLNITAYLDDPRLKTMADIVDPYSYVSRLVMPKLLITTGGDEFFLPDDSYYFWDALQGDKYIRTLPNAEHSCAGHFISLLLSARAFYLSLLMDAKRPTLHWTLSQTESGGSIKFEADTKPSTVMVYEATTLPGVYRRDFRLLAGYPNTLPQPVIWEGKTIQPEPTGEYVANVNAPESGWRAFFIQATFPGPSDSVYEFTTQVNIVPNTFPFPDCQGAECQGKLV